MWGQEDTKYNLGLTSDTFWPWAICETIWSGSPGVPVPSGSTLKRNVEQLLFADLNLIWFQQKRNEV